jgi:molybdopterin molybdotransferase
VRPLAQAQRDILSQVERLPVVEVGLADAAGLVPAAVILAPHDVPPFANSAMDGFAVRSIDTAAAPVRLRVLEDVPAGSVASASVASGTAIRIMTGAPIPVGADAVVRVEDTESDGTEVVVRVPVGTGASVREAGGDIRAGEEVLPAGERLSPQHVGVLASLGVSRPSVHRRPRVAILSTGDEVMPPDADRLPPGAIRDANRPMLGAMLAETGAHVVDAGIVGDDAEALRTTLLGAAGAADLIVTSGGVSVGQYDLVKAVLADLGGVEFWRIAMQPGKPFAFGRVGGTPLFGLPGNPVSVTVAYEQLVRPALLHAMGARRIFRPRVRGMLEVDVATDPERTVFLRVAAAFSGGVWTARPSGGQSSNMLTALARADAFAVVPAGMGRVAAGTDLDLEMFRWPETRTYEEVFDD